MNRSTTKRLATSGLAAACIFAAASVQAGERRLSDAELGRVRGGATIDISGPNDTVTPPLMSSQPTISFKLNYPGNDDEDVSVSTNVNGIKSAQVRVQPSQFGEYVSLRAPIPLPLAEQNTVELKYCTQSLLDAGASCPVPSAGGDAKRTYEFSPSLKIAGVNFWHLKSGSASLGYEKSHVVSAVSETNHSRWVERTDGILEARTNAYGQTNSDTIKCFTQPWNFTHRKVSSIEMPSEECFTPTITTDAFPDDGPDPLCPTFESVVDDALRNELDYVNVVAVKNFTIWNPRSRAYEPAVGVDGAHTRGKRWFIVRRFTNLEGGEYLAQKNFAKTIVHEWGHQIGVLHSTGPACDPFVAGSRLDIMCEGGFKGLGMTKAFCDAAARYTGTRNLNPSR